MIHPLFADELARMRMEDRRREATPLRWRAR